MDKETEFEMKRLSANNEYYSSVFKKTERIISVVFYILSHIEKSDRDTAPLKVLVERAFDLETAALTTLGIYESDAREHLFPLERSLVALEGSLRIANAARYIADEALAILLGEIDLVQRYLRHHYSTTTPVSLRDGRVGGDSGARLPRERKSPPASRQPRSGRVAIPTGDISSEAHLVYSQLVDRATRIKTVLEAMSEATIKDIAQVITDVSEKTIQRELNSLIEKGQVIRQGERRWSKYSLVR